MKKLETTEIEKISRGQILYLLLHSPYSRAETYTDVFKGNGNALVEKLKEIFEYEEWELENDLEHLSEEDKIGLFLKYCSDYNGDGYDYVEIYQINQL